MAFGTAETAKLIVDLSLKGNFASQLGKVNQSLAKTNLALNSTSSRAYKAGTQIGTGIKRGAIIAAAGVGFIASQVAAGVNSLVNLEKATAQTEAVLKSTKGAAGQTAEGIRALAEGFENLNAQMDDTVIQSGANVLLTFTNIGKKAFKPALQAALDLSQAMGQDLQTSVIQIGKALNDPAKGLTSLQRIGVSFSKDQVKLIKHFLAINHLGAAQTIILQELGKEFGGSFARAGKTAAGQFASIGDAVEDLQRNLATAFLPVMSKVATAIDKTLRDPAVIKGIRDFGDALANFITPEGLSAAGDTLKGIFNAAREAAPVLADAAKVMGGIVSTAVNAFKSLPPEIQKLAIGAFAINKLTGGLVTNLAGGLISAVLGSFKGVLGVNAGVVNVNGGVVNGGGDVPLPGGASGIKKIIRDILPYIPIAGIAAAASYEITQQANQQMGTNFAAPGSAGDNPLTAILPFGIGSSLQNIAEGLRILTGGRPVPVHDDDSQTEIEKLRGDLTRNGPRPSERHLDPTNRKTTFSGVEALRGTRFAPEVAKGLKDAGVANQHDIESLRGKIAEGLKPLATQRDIESVRGTLANNVNPSVIGVGGDVEAARGAIVGAIANKDLSIDQKIAINVNVSAAGVTKSVTIQNRYGPGNGSSGKDLGGPNGSGGGVNSGAG